MHNRRNREKRRRSQHACPSMNYTDSCSKILFDLALTALSGGVATHYTGMNMNEPGGVPLLCCKTHTRGHMKDEGVCTSAGTQCEIMTY